MDNRPIGVFDSGLGGLTVVTELLRTLPNERVIYFGDTARTPYGSKSVRTIKAFAEEIVHFLHAQNTKLIMVACNTVSSTALPLLQESFPDLPIVGIIRPVVVSLSQQLQQGKLAVIGTRVTVESGLYADLFAELAPQMQIVQKACPLFVPMVEEGLTHHAMMPLAIHHYLDDFLHQEAPDGLILGCTHYPLIADELQAIYPHLPLYNPAAAQTAAVERLLAGRDALAAPDNPTENRFYASDLSENFRSMIRAIVADQPQNIEFHSWEG